MFRDTLSVSWSYSCYIVCCWLAINILIVLAFFPSLYLEWDSPNSILHLLCLLVSQKSTKKIMLMDLLFWLSDIRKSCNKYIFCAVEGCRFASWSPIIVCLSYNDFSWRRLIESPFDSSTFIPKYRIDLYETHSNRVPYICHNFEKCKTGSSRVKDQRERERCVSFFFLLFAVHGKYWGMVASSSSCLWGNEKPVKKWKQPKGKNLI